jgi:hypothetical protein
MSKKNNFYLIIFVALLLLFAVLHACSAESTNRGDYSATSAGSGGYAGTAGTQEPGGTAGIPLGIVRTRGDSAANTGTSGSVDSGADACAVVSKAAQQVEVQTQKEVQVKVEEYLPVAIYIMLDQSASMLIPGLVGSNPFALKWQVAYDSITAFINDPLSENIDVAIQYFPLGALACDASIYAKPDVPIGRLPAQASVISASLTAHSPFSDNTPVEPALSGATSFCASFKNDTVKNPDHEDCAVIFITDGMPNGCNQDSNALASIAGDAFKNSPNVKTFAIGMSGADFNLLNLISQSGGTDCTPNDPATYACDVSSGMTLLEALELIRQSITRIETHMETQTVVQTIALDCEWTIPEPPSGENFDRGTVNVEFSPTGSQTDKQILGMIPTGRDCGTDLGWHYDVPDAPTRIVACPETCKTIKSAQLATINIVLGCETQLLIK